VGVSFTLFAGPEWGATATVVWVDDALLALPLRPRRRRFRFGAAALESSRVG